MRKIVIVVEEENEVTKIPVIRRKKSISDGWICPYCGKRVYSMEVHPCNQPTCSYDFIYEEDIYEKCHPEDGPFCWNFKEHYDY